MSQLAAEGPTHRSSKATVGGLIKSVLVYALLSVIPPAKQGITVPAPRRSRCGTERPGIAAIG